MAGRKTGKNALWRTTISESAGIPSGSSEDEYPNYMSWANSRWAWEFLRRNKEFQKRCDALPERGHEAQEHGIAIAREFGLKKFKDYKESYGDQEDMNPEFSVLKVFVNSDPEKDKVIERVLIRPGQVLARFELMAVKKSARAIQYQIAEVTEILTKEMMTFAEKKDDTRLHLIETPRAKLILLRMVDLLNSKALTKAATYRTLYPNLVRPDSKNGELSTALKSKYRQAQRLVDRAYLALVSL